MLSGVVSSENLAQVLRSISQKRKQGVLEITLGDKAIQLLFVAGKIVDAYQSPQIAVHEVLETLAAAGVLPDGFIYRGTNYQDLFSALELAGCALDQDEFKVVLSQRVLDVLYGLQLDSGAFYSFKVQMIEHEPELMPSISVGQLLLDFVALEDDEDRFLEAFPADFFVVLEDEVEALTIEEGFLLHALQNHHYVSELQSASMLSRFHFRECLFSLLNRGAIDVRPELDGRDHGDSRPLEDIVATLEGSLEHTIENAHFESAFDDLALKPEWEDSKAGVQEQSTGIVEEAPLRVSILGILNARLLQASWVPGVLVLLFLVSAIFAPVLSWDSCVRAFSHF